jgi:HEPN domain-containing protein
LAKQLNDIVLQWKIKADNDLTVAEKELISESPVTDAICFHCQQSVEKYLKLFLIVNGIEPKKTHLISDLLIDCIKIDKDFETLRDASYLSDYAVELRYPDDFYIPDISEAKDAYNSASIVKIFVLKKCPQILDK